MPRIAIIDRDKCFKPNRGGGQAPPTVGSWEPTAHQRLPRAVGCPQFEGLPDPLPNE